MGEANQVKWVGTRKVAPAIADLQAIEAVVTELQSVTTTVGGTNSLNHPAVPAGKIHVITAVVGFNVTTAPSYITHNIYEGDTRLTFLYTEPTPGANAGVLFTGLAILDSGQHIRTSIGGCNIGDAIRAGINGYQIDKD